MLVEGPLPRGYDPQAQHRDFVAHVLVSPEGKILRARLSGSSGRGATDRAILATIHRDWRFVELPEKPTWLRIRLDEPDYPLPPPPAQYC